MSHHIAIVQGHPDPAGGRLCHALADAYAEAAQAAAHQVSRIEIAGLDFPFLRSIADSELPEALVGPKAALLAANHIVSTAASRVLVTAAASLRRSSMPSRAQTGRVGRVSV